ncbi:MAG: hypothetical protein ACM3JC_10890 [Rudaea sp.]
MNKRIETGFAVLGLSLLLGACAEAPEKESGYREEPVYRTGSNIPVKDYRPEHVEVVKPDVINPINRPMPSVMNKKPAG